MKLLVSIPAACIAVLIIVSAEIVANASFFSSFTYLHLAFAQNLTTSHTGAAPIVKSNGTIPILPTIMKALKSQIHISLSQASANAAKAVGANSSAIEASIHPQGGFLVYVVYVIDTNNNPHRVTVDPGSGKVLSNQQIPIGTINSILLSLFRLFGGMIPPHTGGGIPLGPSKGVTFEGIEDSARIVS